jgi:hypothetical protein
VLRLAEQIGWDGKLTGWLYNLTKDCPRKQGPGLSDPCGGEVSRSAEGGLSWPATRDLQGVSVRRPHKRSGLLLLAVDQRP